MVASTRNTNRNTTQQHRRSAVLHPWIMDKYPTRKVVKGVEPMVKVSETDKLNPPSKGTWIFKNENGAIQYGNSMMQGCCGVGVVYNVTFGNIKEGMEEQFYKDVEEHLLSDNVSGNLHRGSIMMSDAVGGERNKQEKGIPSIYEMCTVLGWEKTSQYYNPRSGNYIVVFIKEKDNKSSVFCSHPRGDKPLVIKWDKTEEGE